MELQRWGHLRVCSWIIYIFPLLTEILEKSAPERCWTVVLIGYCFRDPCRGQWPKYKHLSASELLTWRNFHSRCACLGSAELLGQQKKNKKKVYANSDPLAFWWIGTRTQNQSMAQWLGWFRIHWLEYIIPETTFRRQWRRISIEKFKFHSTAWGALQIQNQADNGILNIQKAQICFFFFFQDRMELGMPILFGRPESTDQADQE